MTVPTQAQIEAAKLAFMSTDNLGGLDACLAAAITAAAEVRPADISCPFCGGENGKHDLNCGLYRPAPTQAQIEAIEIAKEHLRRSCMPDARDTLAKIAALAAAAEAGEKTNLEANRLYRYLNGLDQDSHDKRAEHVMQQSLDGLSIGPDNRNSTKEILANHFEAVEAATIERCARAVWDAGGDNVEFHVAAIRALSGEG